MNDDNMNDDSVESDVIVYDDDNYDIKTQRFRNKKFQPLEIKKFTLNMRPKSLFKEKEKHQEKDIVIIEKQLREKLIISDLANIIISYIDKFSTVIAFQNTIILLSTDESEQNQQEFKINDVNFAKMSEHQNNGGVLFHKNLVIISPKKHHLCIYDYLKNEITILYHLYTRPTIIPYTFQVAVQNRIFRFQMGSKYFDIINLENFNIETHQFKNNNQLLNKFSSFSSSYILHQNHIYIFENRYFTTFNVESYELLSSDSYLQPNKHYWNPGLISTGEKLYIMRRYDCLNVLGYDHDTVEEYNCEEKSWQICSWKLPCTGSYSASYSITQQKLYVIQQSLTNIQKIWSIDLSPSGKIGVWHLLSQIKTRYHRSTIGQLQTL